MKLYKMNFKASKEQRKQKSISILKENNIDYIDHLPCTFETSDVVMKSKEIIAKRYIACIITIQVAFDILENNDINYSIKFFGDLIEKYKVYEYLSETEKKVFSNELSRDQLVNFTWQYESINVLAWVLGLNKNLLFPNQLCDVMSLLSNIATCQSFEEFLNKCNLINVDDILDELDLEYRYHWAVVDKRINESTNIGELDGEIVVERRRALEWLFSDEDDWNNISLDT